MAMKSYFWRVKNRFMRGNFEGSERYWQERYRLGGNSGAGSYGVLAEFKARILNDFVSSHGLASVIEFGCGDGNQLSLAEYPEYLGFDVSQVAIEICRRRFRGDATKSFALMDDYDQQSADVTLSLDVIYHLVEDDTYLGYMRQLFEAAREYVIVYSTNTTRRSDSAPHVRHRAFTEWVDSSVGSNWKLVEHIPNDHVANSGMLGRGSDAEFFIFGRVAPPQLEFNDYV